MTFLRKLHLRLSRSLFYRSQNHLNELEMRDYIERIPQKVAEMRKKDKITVLFVAYEVSKWKFEGLYHEMQKHPRFEPVIGLTSLIAETPNVMAQKTIDLENYFKENNLDFEPLSSQIDIQRINPDIIFYVEPYNGIIKDGLFYKANRQALFGYISYGFHIAN